MDIWKAVEITQDSPYFWRIGHLALWGRIQHDELLVTFRYEEDEAEECRAGSISKDSLPEDATWNRFILQDRGVGIRLRPALPDRPIVATPEFPLHILPNGEARFYVSVPLWVQITAGMADFLTVLEIPSRDLSNTWFGDTMTGELCYALNTRARRNIEKDKTTDHVISCPLTMKNCGNSALDVQKLSLHVEHLGVYRTDRGLWSNEVRTVYPGGEQPAEVHYLDKEPEWELLNAARSPVQKSVLIKGFGFIKKFALSDQNR
jgi:hypothetical protein